MTELIFGYLAGAIIILALLAITRRNPVHSVLFMLIMFFHVAGLYLILNAEFLAAIQLIVYAGAILVLFLFVLLLLNLREELTVERYIGPWPFGLSAAAALALGIFTSLRAFTTGREGNITAEVVKAETNTKILGKALFTDYLYPFEVLSVILLVAIIGAIVLTKKRIKS